MASKHNVGRVFDRIDPLVLHPGAGWKSLGSSVWEHKSGTRIHVGGGLIKTPTGKCFWLNSIIGRMGWQLIKINGGNKKRGLMAWAMNSIPQNKELTPTAEPDGVERELG